jgi:predicted acetyltransferase
MPPGLKVSLAFPSWPLRESYIETLREFQAEDPSRPIRWDWLETFETYLDWVKQEREQVGVIEERVPQTTYWIVWEDKLAVGKLSLRHQLTPKLEKLGGHIGYEVRPSFRRRGIATQALALGLEKARGIGLETVVITCDDDNPGSIGALERNGGLLEETYRLSGRDKAVRRYSFSL